MLGLRWFSRKSAAHYGRTVSALVLGAWSLLNAQTRPKALPPVLDRVQLARRAFGNDAAWYLQNIPFLEIDDPALQQTYYYRWQVYRSHLRELGPAGNDVTEFLPSVPWARHPYEDLNDSSSFHILEGRWLRNPAYVSALVEHLYAGGGNDRHFSESVASATYGWTLVTGNPAPAIRQLAAMQYVYSAWDDHFDARRNLYWIEPLLDATEYTIASIDASGAGFTGHPDPHNDGFGGGYGFRPSINSYQYGNARAIAALLRDDGQPGAAAEYDRKAEALRAAVQAQLWNPALHHFTDVYQRSTPTVTAGTFIRGRELVGLVPWQFGLPAASERAATPDFAAEWHTVLGDGGLAGPFGLRTNEPSYPRYLTQYRYVDGTRQPECQWNGPSWPFQTSQVLSGLSNLLDSYPAATVRSAGASPDLFVHLLRQYTRQHWQGGRPDLQEDYNPDTGAVIVGLPRSHHYLHSTYVDLILSGLIGIRPRADDVLELRPLLPTGGDPSLPTPERPIRFFALEDLQYHGHTLALVYDADGTHYGLGPGLTIFAEGRVLLRNAPLGPVEVRLPPAIQPSHPLPEDLAVNVWGRPPSAHEQDLPVASASSANDSEGSAPALYQPLDGRLWFFPEVPHGWSPAGPEDAEPWYAVDLRHLQRIGSVDLAFLADGTHFAAPAALHVQFQDGTAWRDLPGTAAVQPVPNGITHIAFKAIAAQRLRVVLEPPRTGTVRLIAFRVYSPSEASR